MNCAGTVGLKITAIVITIYSPCCLAQETAKGPFGLRVKLLLARQSTKYDKSFTLPFQYWTSNKEAVSTNFYSLWFDPTRYWTRVYCFSNKRSIHSNIDRLNDVICPAKQFREQSLKLYDFCENEITAHK